MWSATPFRDPKACLCANWTIVVNPNFEPFDLQLMKMKKKVDAGAEFFQTQAVYDVKTFERFIKKAEKFGRPIQLGVVVLKSPGMGKYMNDHVSGIKVPREWIDDIGSVDKKDRKKKATETMAGFIRTIKPMVQGIHIMPLGWTDVVPEIIEQADIKISLPAGNEKEGMTGRGYGIFSRHHSSTTKLFTLSFRRIPDRAREESSQSEPQGGYFGSMLIGGIWMPGEDPDPAGIKSGMTVWKIRSRP